MRNIFIILATSLLLVGCSLFPERVVYEEYPIPVYTIPEPPEIERPSLPIHSLSERDRDDSETVIRAYVISTRLLLNYAVALEEIVQAYADLAETTKNQVTFPNLLGQQRRTVSGVRPLSSLEANRVEQIRSRNHSELQNKLVTIKNQYEENKKAILEEFFNE